MDAEPTPRRTLLYGPAMMDDPTDPMIEGIWVDHSATMPDGPRFEELVPPSDLAKTVRSSTTRLSEARPTAPVAPSVAPPIAEPPAALASYWSKLAVVLGVLSLAISISAAVVALRTEVRAGRHDVYAAPAAAAAHDAALGDRSAR